mmetsp:Transcript_34522/g.25614  ORF Transcript_34522/g.25614 Transcript_34522/m.25614 type:complete len:193 (-) Transcript_34522:1008-1586(-)
MEFVWRPSYNSLGSRVQIFTHALYHHYSAPDHLNFDITFWGNDPFVDDPDLETYNAESLSDYLYDWIIKQRSYYKSSNVFIPMGDDFNYMNAKMFFESMDKLISFFNARFSTVSLAYSTPSAYVAALNAEGWEWPTKYDDMFPYADNSVTFWSGYFTSRSNLKEYIRRASRHLTAAHNLYALQFLNQSPTVD